MKKIILAIGVVLLLTGCTPETPMESSSNPKYNRSDWGDWINQGGGCNTRELVLKKQGSNVHVDSNCKALSGNWISSYDNVTETNPAKLDIDHIVPIKEAWDSGATRWSKEKKIQFYNDLDNLVAVTLTSNRQKGDKDPAKWLPIAADRCHYVAKWKSIKARYQLDSDPAEVSAINKLHC